MSTILLIGANGTIGSAIGEALAARGHEVVGVSHRTGTLTVDLGDAASIESMFAKAGQVDAVVSAAGAARFGTLDDLSDEDYTLSVTNKLLGQINLVRFGRGHVRDGGSFTLTSGILADQPSPGSTILSAVNAGLHGFVGSAALQMKNGQRVNVVSPPMIRETVEKLGWGAGGIPAAAVAQLFVEAVDGDANGSVFTHGSAGVR